MASILLFTLLIWLSGKDIFSIYGYEQQSSCENNSNDYPFSFLWKINKNPPSYFFGTVHVPYTKVWDYIPENAKEAFQLSDNVYFELDLNDPYTISTLAKCQMLPQGKNLSEILPYDIYQRLKRYLDRIKENIPSWTNFEHRRNYKSDDNLFNAITRNWEHKRPVWVMLMVNSLKENDVNWKGIPVLDLYLAQQAEKMKKKIGAVEEVEEQCIPLNALNLTQVLFALNQTLQSIDNENKVNVSRNSDDLIHHYNCRNLNSIIFNQDTTQLPKLTNMTSEDMDVARDMEHYFRDEFIYKRNKKIGDRVIQLILNHPNETFFFAFGAGHFLGNNTILDFIQIEGFQVTNIPSNKRIFKQRKSDDKYTKGLLYDWKQRNNPRKKRIAHKQRYKRVRNVMKIKNLENKFPKKIDDKVWFKLETK
ncbi:metalloprotease TIKI1-like [Centruroides sculpturatus]|uniref:metalloprotease TIKI1-like n=1 Tax=Centruroides sculpturatus TaxID=218467 RepID=UPI000C6D1C3B|nr:metalloprotease TIKI1-like [Centruroides sculpturatus]